MLITGRKTREKQIDAGIFTCPKCDAQRNYSHNMMGRWFTLFFIPILKIESLGEYVECQTCRRTFIPDAVLDASGATNGNEAENAQDNWSLAGSIESGVIPAQQNRGRRIMFGVGVVLLPLSVMIATMSIMGGAGDDPNSSFVSHLFTTFLCFGPFITLGAVFIILGKRKQAQTVG